MRHRPSGIGDGDRVGIVDSNGDIIAPSEIIAVVAERFLPEDADNSGTEIMYNVVSSRLARDHVEQLGGIPFLTPVGHAQIKGIMRRPEHDNCLFAGEHSGHYFFKDFYLADSGMIAALVIVEAALAAKDTGRDLRSRRAGWRKKYFSRLETNFDVHQGNPGITDDESRDIMQASVERARQFALARGGRAITEYGGGLPLESLKKVDVLRMELDDDFGSWWFVVRPSGSESLLRMVVEVVLADDKTGQFDGPALLSDCFDQLVSCIGAGYLEDK